MTRSAERRAGAAGESRFHALVFAAWLLVALACAVIAGCTGPGLDPPRHGIGGDLPADAGARDGGGGPHPRAGSGASGQGGRSGGGSGMGSGTAGQGPDDDAGPGLDAATPQDAALPDAGLSDASTDGGDAGAAP